MNPSDGRLARFVTPTNRFSMADSVKSNPRIKRIATYLPEAILDTEELTRRFEIDTDFVENKIGIRQRRIAAADEAVSDMAVSAAERLFENSDVQPSDIELLIVCTQNPDYNLPTTANLVQDRLGIPMNCAAFDINQGCSGYVYGLATASSLMQVQGFKSALFITSEAYSKVMDPNDRSTVPLFGDGAAATLLSEDGTGEIGRFTFGSDGSGADDLIVRAGGSRNPDMPVAGEGALYMNGRAIYSFMMRRVPADVDACLSANGLTRDDIDLFIFHQASQYMVQSLAKGMKLDPGKVPFTLQEAGNTVCSTLPMVIDSLGGVEALSGKRALLCGFGVGLSWASTVISF